MTELASVGTMGIACDKLARMVALSDNFQTKTQLSTYSQARERVYRRNVIGAADRPFAIVSQWDPHELKINAGGDRNYFIHGGELFLALYIDTPPEYYSDNILAETYADNFFSPVINDVAALANADDPTVADRVVADEGHLDIREISRVAFSETAEENWKTIGRFWVGHYLVSWGGV